MTANLNIISAPFIIPIVPVDSQSLQVTLANQTCQINIFTKQLWVPSHNPGETVTNPPVFAETNPIFLDLYLNDVLIVGGVLCLNNVGIVRDPYFGFIGDLAFTDLQGNEDPQVIGLGTRWILNYWPNLA